MHVFQGERSRRTMAVPSSRKLWRALREVDTLQRCVRLRLWQSIRADTQYGPAITTGRLIPPHSRLSRVRSSSLSLTTYFFLTTCFAVTNQLRIIGIIDSENCRKINDERY
jgi:hypothetical protein